jgi:hypothetical protein
MAKIVQFEGQLVEFPAEATDEQIAAALASTKKPGMFDDLIPIIPAPPSPWALWERRQASRSAFRW